MSDIFITLHEKKADTLQAVKVPMCPTLEDLVKIDKYLKDSSSGKYSLKLSATSGYQLDIGAYSSYTKNSKPIGLGTIIYVDKENYINRYKNEEALYDRTPYTVAGYRGGNKGEVRSS